MCAEVSRTCGEVSHRFRTALSRALAWRRGERTSNSSPGRHLPRELEGEPRLRRVPGRLRAADVSQAAQPGQRSFQLDLSLLLPHVESLPPTDSTRVRRPFGGNASVEWLLCALFEPSRRERRAPVPQSLLE